MSPRGIRGEELTLEVSSLITRFWGGTEGVQAEAKLCS